MVFKKIIKKMQEEKEVILGDATKDKLYSSDNEFPTKEQASTEFKRSIQKLFHVNQWSDMPGITSTFELHDANGEKKPAIRPEVGDYVRIVLPGPVPENWVTVVDIKETEETAEFTVSPSINPTKRREDQDEIQHFFIPEATSTFKVQLADNRISAFEIGRNEGINNAEDAGNRKLLNTLIAEGGWAGVQEFQWNKLTDFLVHKIELE
ncbi:MAG TPA: hypothetical protein VKX33_14115 [Cyclobacteriaceae bacterium]|nr:hypothetical protein [Cyclobacteriaceae bacterium]